jgi:ATP-binding cassette subfamily B protein
MIRSLIRPWRALIGVIAVCVLLAQSLNVAPPLIVQKIVDEHLTTGVRDGLVWLAWLYFGSLIAMRSVNALGSYLTSVVAQGALHELRVRLFAHLQALPMRYYDQTPLGDIISRGTADVETVDTLFSSGVATLVSGLFSLLTIAAAMAALSLPLSLVTLLIVPFLVAITQFFRVRVREAERANRAATGLMNTHLQETLGGVEVIRAFRREAMFVARFRAALRQVVASYNRSTAYNSFYPPLMAVLSSLIVALLLWLGASGIGEQWGVTVGLLTAFVLLFRRFFTVIIDLGDQWQTVQSALSGLERIAQVLAVSAEDHLQSPGAAPPLSVPAPRPQFAIILDSVTFGYFEPHAVVRDFSLDVRAGEHVALVGRTGAGKTSALHLLAGLYAPWSGIVRVAGRDPRALTTDERRHIIGVVPQTVQLFSGTVVENLTLGDADVPREAVERAAVIAGADDFIRALPLGYDTPLSGAGRGGGAQLSAGQRQLLALARALVWNPHVLLLDEATAAVDNASDAAFRAALRADAACHQRAVLTVAHRLSTAREADRVFVVEAGRIVEEGTPAELIARGGRFAALAELEAAGWDWRDAPVNSMATF